MFSPSQKEQQDLGLKYSDGKAHGFDQTDFCQSFWPFPNSEVYYNFMIITDIDTSVLDVLDNSYKLYNFHWKFYWVTILSLINLVIDTTDLDILVIDSSVLEGSCDESYCPR